MKVLLNQVPAFIDGSLYLDIKVWIACLNNYYLCNIKNCKRFVLFCFEYVTTITTKRLYCRIRTLHYFIDYQNYHGGKLAAKTDFKKKRSFFTIVQISIKHWIWTKTVASLHC